MINHPLLLETKNPLLLEHRNPKIFHRIEFIFSILTLIIILAVGGLIFLQAQTLNNLSKACISKDQKLSTNQTTNCNKFKYEAAKLKDLDYLNGVVFNYASNVNVLKDQIDNLDQIYKNDSQQLAILSEQVKLHRESLEKLNIPELANIQAPKDNLSYKDKLNQIKNYSNELDKLNSKAIDKINLYLDGLNSKVQIYSTAVELDKFANFYDGYKILSDIEKIHSYPRLQDEIAQLDKIIVDNNLINKSLNDPNIKLGLTGKGNKDYKEIYNSFVYKNIIPAVSDVVITGNKEADARIISLAEGRGYIRRAQAVESSLVPIGGNLLQVEAKKSLEKLTEMAKKDGLNLTLVSGYRSVNSQRDIFLSRFGRSVQPKDIISGSRDQSLNQVLDTTSIPGYSRHHTGYTFDLGCGNSDLLAFKNTKCFEWISKNDYQNAKIVGLIPSYPENSDNQGPEPESWEYVWVGSEAINF